MRRRWLIALAAVAGVLLAFAAAVYGYDAAKADVVAHGVRVDGVELGGLDRGEARSLLQAKLVPRLQRSVTVRYEDRAFRLSADAADVRPDVDAMVDAALDRTRRGNLVSRFFRELDGNQVRAALPARVGFSKDALRTFALNVKRTLDRPPKDAKVEPLAFTLKRTPSQNGVSVRPRRLLWAIAAELVRGDGSRVVQVPVRTVQPKVTTANLAKKYPFFITIDRSERRLRLFQRLRLAKIYTIAVGQIGLETPAGLYRVETKAVNPAWHVPNSAWAGSLAGRVIPSGDPGNPIEARWMGIYDGAGIHGTNDIGSLGSAASHGCIRMSIPDVEELYSIVPLHTPVYIA